MRVLPDGALAAKDTPWTGPSISDEMVPSIVAEDGIALGVYCWLAGAPPIHFGREDGVERTLLRVACQSETFLASPWQGDANIRFLWHIGCQSEFEECFRRMTRISFVIYRHTGFSPVH